MTAAWLGALCIGLSLGLLGSGGSILTVPILAVFLHGREVSRTVGARPAAAIQDFVRQAVGSSHAPSGIFT
jgi:uncharacterized membrane protein YfcA